MTDRELFRIVAEVVRAIPETEDLAKHGLLRIFDMREPVEIVEPDELERRYRENEEWSI